MLKGNGDDVDRFRNYILDHAEQEYPHPLVIVIGNSEKTNLDRMSNTSKKYFKLKFEKFKGNDIGTPLVLSGSPNQYPTNDQTSMVINGYGQHQQAKTNNIQQPNQAMSYNEIQGIIDRNVSDASRSIRAEYQEVSAKQEADSIKRMAVLEANMEMYKLDIRTRELEEKERRLNEQLEEFEQQKAEGLGNVKDYTKTIASGLVELGKSAFGIEDSKINDKKNTEKKQYKKSNFTNTSFNDNRFEEKSNNEVNPDNNLDLVLKGITNLDEEQKYALLEALMPQEEEIKTEKSTSNQQDSNADIPTNTESAVDETNEPTTNN